MSITIREALEAIAIITAMIAVIAVPHPANAGMERKEIKQLTTLNSSNIKNQYSTSDVSHGCVHSKLRGVSTYLSSRFNQIKKEVR